MQKFACEKMDFYRTVLAIIFIILNPIPSGSTQGIHANFPNVTFEEIYATQAANKIYRELRSWYYTLVNEKTDDFDNNFLKTIQSFGWGFPVMMLNAQAKICDDKIDIHGKTTYIVTQPRLSLKVVDHLITTLKHVRTWKPRSNVVFLLKLPVNTTKYYMYDVKQHFDLLWSRRIVNTILILWSERMKIYTFNPFTDEIMDISDITGIEAVLEGKFKDLNGYPLRVTLFRKITSESRGSVNCNNALTSTLMKYLKARCMPLEPQDDGTVGLLYENGTATGATADLLTGYSDIELNSRILKLQYYGYIDTTYPLTQDDLIFLVTKGTKQDSFTAVLSFLPPTFLLLLIAIMTSVIVLALWIRKFEKKWFGIPHRHCTGSVAMDLLKCFLRQSVVILFSGVAFRTIVFAIQVYSLVLNCAIDGVVTTAVTYPTYYPDMDTLNELANSDYKIIIHKRHIDIVEKNFAPELAARVQVISEEKILELLDSKVAGNAYLMRKSDATYISSKKSNIINERPFYHRMAESPIPCLIVYGLRHGSPYLPRVNHAISLFSESGILSYWSRVKSYSLYNQGKKVLYDGASRVKSPLDMGNTYGLFYVWLAGAMLSIGVFAVEILYVVVARILHHALAL